MGIAFLGHSPNPSQERAQYYRKLSNPQKQGSKKGAKQLQNSQKKMNKMPTGSPYRSIITFTT